MNPRQDGHGNYFLHFMARRGDGASSALKTLLSLRLMGGGGRAAVTTDVYNKKGEHPIHVAATAERCQIDTIQALCHASPDCVLAHTTSGDLPLHYACQRGRDPTLLAMLLHHDRNKMSVNHRRNDDCTPLHLVACR